MADNKQVQTQEERDEKNVEVQVSGKELSEAEAQKAQELVESKRARAQSCTRKINEILKEYNCYTDIYVTIGTDQKISGSLEIKAR